jgi:2-isopropylmalate synthase
VKAAADPRIHLFIATSPLHMEYKLRMTPEQVLERAAAMTAYAKRYCANVEFSAEDATRSDPDFLCRVVEAVIRSGAAVVNLPDTVGYTTPEEMRRLMAMVIARVPGSHRAEFSVHCHNDLGMAVANSLAGVQGGARQIECTINGLGERAGNTSLEEAVMAMHTRPDLFGEGATRIDTTQIARASRTVYSIIGQTAPLNKPIVGRNAFLHESGIHQHGILANKRTYEILTPEAVGIRVSNLVLGKRSGRHAFADHLQAMGYDLTEEELSAVFGEFKALCDKKKDISDRDSKALITHSTTVAEQEEGGYQLDWFAVQTTNFTTATSTVSLKKGAEKFQAVSLGDGPIDAAFQAIDEIVKPVSHTFEVFRIDSTSEGKDTMGDVRIKLQAEGRTFSGHGLSTDIIEASVLAYIQALNRLNAWVEKQQSAE